MGLIGLTVLFFLPATYIARSKGYKPFPIFAGLIIPCVILDGIIFIAAEEYYYISIAIPPLLSFLLIWLLPEKEGAPGKQYLKISFTCPECDAELTFPRSKEGTAQLCPKCNEIITIPTDEFSPAPAIPMREKPPIESGVVCYASFGDEMLALQLQALFEDAGIEAEVIGGIGGGSLPLLSGSQGFRLAIDIADWDKAVEVEADSQSVA